ncbi:MAG: ribosome maturation factor RimP [Synergistaceae bacterium]|nr:ribosome maturation factor RimP [Synergistaceae bacterium]
MRKNIVDLAESLGYECVGAEIASRGFAPTLRIYIDSPGGVLHADCERVSRAVSDYLERREEEGTEWFSGKYCIETSSPGLERPLFTAEHYARFAGSDVALMTHDRKKITGRIVSCKDGVVTLEAPDGGTVSLPFAGIKRGNLVFTLQKGTKKKQQFQR